MSIDAGLPTPFFPGRAAHQGTPCDEGACADAVTTFSRPMVAAAPAPTLMKSRRPIDSRTGSFESFMVILLKGPGQRDRASRAVQGDCLTPLVHGAHVAGRAFSERALMRS